MTNTNKIRLIYKAKKLSEKAQAADARVKDANDLCLSMHILYGRMMKAAALHREAHEAWLEAGDNEKALKHLHRANVHEAKGDW